MCHAGFWGLSRGFPPGDGKRFRDWQQKLPGGCSCLFGGWFVNAGQIHDLTATALNADVGDPITIGLQR